MYATRIRYLSHLEVKTLVGLLADAPLPGTQRAEVLASPRDNVRVELEHHPPDWCLIDEPCTYHIIRRYGSIHMSMAREGTGGG